MRVKELLKKFCPPSARTFCSAQENISSTQHDIQNRLSAHHDMLGQLSTEISANHDILMQLSTEKRQYNHYFEYNFIQKNGFFQAVISETLAERYMRLVDGLDEESIDTVNQILARIQILEKRRELPLDIFNDDEKEKLALLSKDFESRIVKLSDNCYAFRQYRLPICWFEPCVFLDKHGISKMSTDIQSLAEKDFVDAGGFIGDSCLILSPYTKRKVYTFEPVKENFERLKRTVEMNHISNAVCEQMALGNYCGTLSFQISGSGSHLADSETKATEQVPATTLDEYVKEHNLHVGLIKTDLEGMEQDFLMGAKETITEQKPVLLLSMYHNDRDFFGLKPLLESWNLGYCFKVFRGLDPGIQVGGGCLQPGILLETILIAEVL